MGRQFVQNHYKELQVLVLEKSNNMFINLHNNVVNNMSIVSYINVRFFIIMVKNAKIRNLMTVLILRYRKIYNIHIIAIGYCDMNNIKSLQHLKVADYTYTCTCNSVLMYM